MASENSKSVQGPDEQEVTSQRHDQSGGIGEEMAALEQPPSIYSLTLDELQNTLCEPGRELGSLTMDEFLANIWSVEDVQTTAGGNAKAEVAVAEGGVGVGLYRQGSSFPVPAPLCQKMVEEVWAEINQGQAEVEAQPQPEPQAQSKPEPESQPQPQPQSEMVIGVVGGNGREPDLGEMTLEDFLVKAGVVREANGNNGRGGAAVAVAPPVVVQQPQVGMAFPMATNSMYPVMGKGFAYVNGGGVVGHGYAGMAVAPPPPPRPPQAAAAPESPPSSDGMGAVSQVDTVSGSENAPVIGNGAGRKRSAGWEMEPPEKVVERRQHRMIKNRESAARSRARKQAYTVELEAELNKLRKENAYLKAEEKTILLLKKQMLVERMVEQAEENVKAKKAGASHRRSGSCFW